jgi:hypothetical protein
MSARPSGDGLRGIVVYVLFLLGSVFVGPLEAVVGLAAYWLLGGRRDREDGAH